MESGDAAAEQLDHLKCSFIRTHDEDYRPSIHWWLFTRASVTLGHYIVLAFAKFERRQSNRLKAYTLAGLLLVGGSSLAQSASSITRYDVTQTRGSVNIIVANGQGLVAVTDSKVTGPGVRPQYKRKLFKIDDHTICTIAGWYSDSGPTIDGIHYPANAAIPNLVEQYISLGGVPETSSPEEKLKLLSSVFAFALEAVADIGTAFGEPPPRIRSELTISSYVAGTSKILQIDLVPHTDNSRTAYLQENYRSVTGDGGLVYAVAGEGDIAERFFEQPERYHGSDPSMRTYVEAVATDGGKDLSIETLSGVASYLEKLTANDDVYSEFVGGELQTARLQREKGIQVSQPYTVEGGRDPVPGFFRRYDSQVSQDGDSGFDTEWPQAAFVTNSTFIKVSNLSLDNAFLSHNLIQGCVLRYDGSPKFKLDKRNIIQASLLILGPSVDPKSTAITEIIENFPGLRVVDSFGNSVRD